MTRLLAGLLLAMLALTGPAMAQQPFAAAATVNGQAITNYQVQQRALFFSLLRAPNSNLASATDALITEELQNQAARAGGVEVTPAELDEGQAEFAGRAGLETDAFLDALARGGVAPETFRDFVQNGLLWRTFVQQEFGALARPTPSEVERAAASGGSGGSGTVRVLLSEIALPYTAENQREVQAFAQRLSDSIASPAAFAQAARANSRSRTAPRGGRLDFVDLANLPAPIAGAVLSLAPGEVSDPIDLGNFIGLFLLRDIDETAARSETPLSIDYAEYLIPGGRTPAAVAAARRLEARIDTCDDLYGVAQGAPAGTLTRTVSATADIPADLREELALLDDDEISTRLTRGGFLRFVMLCGRVAEQTEENLQALGQQLLSQRLQGYADSLLAELRSDADITR